MISVVDNLLLLWYIGYSLAEYWFAIVVEKMYGYLCTVTVRTTSPPTVSSTSGTTSPSVPTTSGLHIFAAATLVHETCAVVMDCLIDGEVIRLLAGITVSECWMCVYLFIRCCIFPRVISD